MFEKILQAKHVLYVLNIALLHAQVNSADKILELLNVGNSRRKTESTEVNETSSRWVISSF